MGPPIHVINPSRVPVALVSYRVSANCAALEDLAHDEGVPFYEHESLLGEEAAPMCIASINKTVS